MKAVGPPAGPSGRGTRAVRGSAKSGQILFRQYRYARFERILGQLAIPSTFVSRTGGLAGLQIETIFGGDSWDSRGYNSKPAPAQFEADLPDCRKLQQKDASGLLNSSKPICRQGARKHRNNSKPIFLAEATNAI
jgi:hypothetical protein